ncbi:MAG: hypothetical protein R6U43_02425 [Candidatus Krumholzibacteriales bacterium]
MELEGRWKKGRGSFLDPEILRLKEGRRHNMVPDRSELILKCSRKNEDEMGRRLSELEQSMMKDIPNLKMSTERLPPGNNPEAPLLIVNP